jgi:hypothetical protein
VIAVVWQFDVRPERRTDFEKFYGADGDWTTMSRRSRSFIGSSFLREFTAEPRYLLIEYWSEMLPYERHRVDLSEEIDELEQARSELVLSTTPLGVFTALDVPDRFGPTWSQRDGR